MKNKLLALFTIVCVIASMLVIPNVVYADYTSRWTDSFEEGSGSVYSSSKVATDGQGYYYASAGDGLLITTDTAGSGVNPNTASVKWDPAGGYNGTGGLYIYSNVKKGDAYRGTSVATRGVTLEENTAVVLRYKIKFVKMEKNTTGTALNYFFLSGVTGNNTVGRSTMAALTDSNFSWETDEWYTVVTKVTGTTATKATATYILDENNTVKYSGTKDIAITVDTANYTEATQPVYLWPVLTIQNVMEKQLMLDDISLTKYTTDSTQAISFDQTGSNIKNGETGVVVNKTFRLSFDHDLASGAADTVKLYKASDTEKTSLINCNVSASTFDGFSLTPESSLEPLTEYVLDLSGITSAAGALIDTASQSISFTTEEPVADVISSVPANGAIDAAIDAKIMTVTFNKKMVVAPTTVALAGGSTDVIANVATTDNITYTFTWTETLLGLTNYSVSLAEFKDDKNASPTTSSISFKTEDAEIITMSDSFEDASLITNNVSYSSSLLDVLEVARVDSTVEEVTQGDGFTSGTNALQFNTGAGDDRTYLGYVISQEEYDFSSEREYFVATWRFRLDKMATYDPDNYKYGPQIAIGAVCDSQASSIEYSKTATAIQYLDGKPYIKSPREAEGKEREISENKWYNITYVMGKTGASIYFVDTETNEIVYKNNLGHSNRFNSTDYKNYILLMTAPKTKKAADTTKIYNEDQTFTIDDVTIWRIKPSLESQKLATIEDGAVRTITPDGTLDVEFNQPILSDFYDMTLYEVTEGGRKSAYSTPTVTYPDFCKQAIKFSNLKYGHSYALDCSTVPDISGNATKEEFFVEFTTNQNPDNFSVYDDISCTGLDAGDTVNFKLTSKAEKTTKLVVAFYSRSSMQKLEGVQTINQELVVGNNEISIPLTKNMQNAEYIKVFAWDSEKVLLPLIEEREIIAPKKSIKLLMIGSSMTEDTGRFLYDVAQAGGLDLDLTVKGLGGSNLAHHAANIKAELYEGRTGEAALKETQDANAAGEENPRIAYFTYKNGVYQSSTPYSVLLTNVLKDEKFDVISINQASSRGSALDTESLTYVMSEIRKLQPDAQIVLYQTWNGWHSLEATRRGYFVDITEPHVRTMAEEVPKTVSGITYDNAPLTIIPAGYAFNIVDRKYEYLTAKYPNNAVEGRPAEALTETEEFEAAVGLWRDPDHGSYYGCYLAEACWYEFLTGKIAPTVDKNGNPVVKKPESASEEVTDEEHIATLERLRDAAHEAMIEYKNK